MATRYDANTDYMVVTTTLPTITAWTVLVRAKISVDVNGYATIFKVGEEASGANTAYEIDLGADGTTLTGWNGATEVAGSALTVGTYYDIAATCAGTGAGQFLIYLSGVLDITLAGNAGIVMEQIMVGRYNLGSTQLPFDGCIQDILVYNRVLTPAEILQQTRQRFPISTTSLNRWAPCHTAADAATVYAGTGGNWTVGGTLTTEDGPGIPWSTDEDDLFVPAVVVVAGHPAIRRFGGIGYGPRRAMRGVY